MVGHLSTIGAHSLLKRLFEWRFVTNCGFRMLLATVKYAKLNNILRVLRRGQIWTGGFRLNNCAAIPLKLTEFLLSWSGVLYFCSKPRQCYSLASTWASKITLWLEGLVPSWWCWQGWQNHVYANFMLDLPIDELGAQWANWRWKLIRSAFCTLLLPVFSLCFPDTTQWAASFTKYP